MKSEAQSILFLVAGLAVCVGCTRTIVREGAAPGLRVRGERAPYAQVRMNTVNILDDSLQDWQGDEKDRRGKIAVESTNSRRTETGTVEVWAILRNRTDHPLQLEGRVQFFDQTQAPVEGPTAWQRIYLPPNAVATYTEISTRVMDVGNYYIEIREGR